MHGVCIYVNKRSKETNFFLNIFELIKNHVFQFDLKFANGRYA